MHQSSIGYRLRAGSPGPVRSGLSASGSPLALLRIFVRDPRGAASIELALGAVVLISVSTLCFDLYSRIKADTAVARIAVTMADYVSRDVAPDGGEIKALGEFLYKNELGLPAALVYVVTALHQPSGDPLPAVQVLWPDDNIKNTIRIGDEAVTNEIAGECAHFTGGGGNATLPDSFLPMSPDEVLIIVEVCVRLTREGFLTGKFIAGDIYRLHALPARDPNQRPTAPVYAERDGAHTTVADELVFGCDSRRVAGCDILRGEHAYRNDYSSRYTAVGRFGEGRPEDGFPVAGQDFNGAAHQLGGGRDACNRRTRMFDRQEPESVFMAAAATDGREPGTTGVACSDPFDNTSKTT